MNARATDTPDPDPLAADSGRVLDHLNSDHADSLLLVARFLAERPSTTTATAVGIDRYGLDLLLDGQERVRLPFEHEVIDVLGVRKETVALVAAARERSGSTELTTTEREDAAMAAIRTHVTEVRRVEQLTPAMRQITFGGGDLSTYAPGGLDQFLYLLAPTAGCRELAIDRSFSWEEYGTIDPERRPVGAYYTLRRWRPERSELDIIVVLHGDQGEGSAWALRAAPGDPVALWGPRTAFEPPDGTRAYVLVADETGLPAVGAILEGLPAGTPVDAFIEVAGPEEHLDLPTESDARITWLHRGDRPPGSTTLLVEAVRAVAPDADGVYAWGGAESHMMTAVRKYLRNERAFEREAVSMVGYWRLGADDDDDEGELSEEVRSWAAARRASVPAATRGVVTRSA